MWARIRNRHSTDLMEDEDYEDDYYTFEPPKVKSSREWLKSRLPYRRRLNTYPEIPRVMDGFKGSSSHYRRRDDVWEENLDDWSWTSWNPVDAIGGLAAQALATLRNEPEKLPQATIVVPHRPDSRPNPPLPMFARAAAAPAAFFSPTSLSPIPETAPEVVEQSPGKGPRVIEVKATPELSPSVRKKTAAGNGPLFPEAEKGECWILLCVFRNKSHNCLSSRIKVRRPGDPDEWTDTILFKTMWKAYRDDLQGPFRRYLSLKTLKSIVLLHYTATDRPVRIKHSSSFAQQDLMFAFKNPDLLKSKHDWIDWVIALKQDPLHHYGLEFVEDWNGTRIMIMGVVILVSITTMAGIWAGLGGNIQNTFAVASFVLAVCTTAVALLAIYSQIDR